MISIGGTIGALAGSIIPMFGSAISYLLYPPTQLLIWIVDFFNYLPNASFAVGQIELWQLIVLYGLILAVWALPQLQKKWQLSTFLGVLIVIIPLVVWKTTELQITALASNDNQILVIQDRGRAIVVNTGNESVARFVMLPFLQQQAINQIDRAIDFNRDRSQLNNWRTLTSTIPIQEFYSIGEDSSNLGNIKFQPLPIGKAYKFDRVAITTVKTSPAIFQIEIPDFQQKWLVIGDDTSDRAQPAIDLERLTPAQILYWSGAKLTNRSILSISPKIAIAATSNPDPETVKLLEKNKVIVYYTGRDGAIQWTNKDGFKPYLDGERSQ
jgi:competence protein ComEC